MSSGAMSSRGSSSVIWPVSPNQTTMTASERPLALRVDRSAHRYWVGQRELLAVTRVLQDAGLVDATWWTAEGRDRGAVLHRLTEAIDREESVPKLVDPTSA